MWHCSPPTSYSPCTYTQTGRVFAANHTTSLGTHWHCPLSLADPHPRNAQDTLLHGKVTAVPAGCRQHRHHLPEAAEAMRQRPAPCKAMAGHIHEAGLMQCQGCALPPPIRLINPPNSGLTAAVSRHVADTSVLGCSSVVGSCSCCSSAVSAVASCGCFLKASSCPSCC